MAKASSNLQQRRVLFVCTGNICRSPTAEGVFRTLVERDGLSHLITTSSAGTHNYHVGEPPDPRAIRFAAQRGYDISLQRARHLQPTDCSRFHLLVACDGGHFDFLCRLAPGRRAQFKRLLDYAPELGKRDVPDPYYGGPADFEHALDLIERGAAGLLAALKQELA
jgi:protein-tyrosine phosphatase